MIAFSLHLITVFTLLWAMEVDALPRKDKQDTRVARHQLIAERQTQGTCEHGEWTCAGQTLSRCVYGDNVRIGDCAVGTVCSVAGGNSGCVWAVNGDAGVVQPATTSVASVGAANTTPTVASPEKPSSDLTGPAAAPSSSNSMGTAAGITTSTTTQVDVATGPVASPTVPALTANAVVPNGGVATGTVAPSSNKPTQPAPGTPPQVVYSAPHYVLYADRKFAGADNAPVTPDQEKGLGSQKFPTPDQLKGVNRFILSFWVPSKGGIWDNVKVWALLAPAERATILKAYHDAGIALMMAFGGETEGPTTAGLDPIKLATDMATFVKEYGLDGIDIDYEDFTAMNGGTAEAWVIKLQQTLRQLLPKPYLISHAPVAPWFSPTAYTGGAYQAIEKAVGPDSIDWYNVQYYNQPNINYLDCASIFDTSPEKYPKSSVFEIAAEGVIPLSKLVVGKPVEPGRSASGFMDFNALGVCVKAAAAKKWNGGLMIWDWDPNNIPFHSKAFAAAKGGALQLAQRARSG